MRGCLRCRWVLSGWIFGWWGHLVPRLGQTIAQAELRRLPGSGGSWLAWVGWHRPSRVSPQLRLRSPQLASPPSDTSRDSQFESASSKCEPPPRGWFIGRFMATGVGLLAKQWSLLPRLAAAKRGQARHTTGPSLSLQSACTWPRLTLFSVWPPCSR